MNKEAIFTVYKHQSPSGKVYIGITRLDVERRWQKGKNYKSNPYLTSAIKKYGWDSFTHEILFTGLTKEEAECIEVQTIAYYRSNDHNYGYNIEAGGNHVGKVSEETRKKLSEAKKGKYYGHHRKHTEEEKRRISETQKGRVSPMKGRHHSDATRAKRGKAVICYDTGETFLSIHEAAKKTGQDRTNISRVLRGIYKQIGGYHFGYYSDQGV